MWEWWEPLRWKYCQWYPFSKYIALLYIFYFYGKFCYWQKSLCFFHHKNFSFTSCSVSIPTMRECNGPFISNYRTQIVGIAAESEVFKVTHIHTYKHIFWVKYLRFPRVLLIFFPFIFCLFLFMPSGQQMTSNFTAEYLLIFFNSPKAVPMIFEANCGEFLKTTLSLSILVISPSSRPLIQPSSTSWAQPRIPSWLISFSKNWLKSSRGTLALISNSQA